MKSNLAKDAEQKLIQATQRLQPEQRLHAFLEHNGLIAQLYAAGQRLRSAKPR